MELLTILYALLAAVTGIGGGERVALVERAAMAAPASTCCASSIGVVRAVRAQRQAHRPQGPARILSQVREARPLLRVSIPAVFDLASFANRRE